MSEKVYSRVTEAEEMIKALCERQPEVLWCVRPNMVAVYGIENKERSKKNDTLAKVKPIKGCEKAVLQDNNIAIRYIIDIYWSDWREWDEKKRQWILLHELIHIHSEVGKTIKHDSEDFKIILDKVGVNWVNSKDLPNLLLEDVKFNLELRPSMEEEEEEKDEIPEEEMERKKNAKAKKEPKAEKKEASEGTDETEPKEGDIF